ncbi:MAG: hypothetical protein PVG44_11285 [Desulfobacterales bacterium]|jgi:hypothetical protein
MPAKAGIQNYLKILDSRLRGKDVKGCFKTFYETTKIGSEKWKKVYSTKDVVSTFYDDARQTSDFYFFSENTPQ